MTSTGITSTPPVILSAYNAAAPNLTEHPDTESEWYRTLREQFEVGGLELASAGATLHPRGVPHLAALLDPAWRNVVGGMGCTLGGLASDPDYGLASSARRARSAAVADIDSLRGEILELRGLVGDDAVQAIVLHSAPGAARGSAQMLEESLLEIIGFDWGRMTFLLEHVDALIVGQEPQKGWQPLESEISVVHSVRARTGADVRLLMNWGRATIETRSATGADALITRAAESGLLGALTLSGASRAASARGGRWADVHLGLSTDEPDSLLSPEIAIRVLNALPSDAVFIGVKVGAPMRPGPEAIDRLRFAKSILDGVLRPHIGRV